MSLFKKKIILFIFIIIFPQTSHTLEVMLQNNKLVYIKHNNFDKSVSEIAKSHCSSFNKNTYFFRTKNKETYDVDLGGGFLFFRNENNRVWRFFCATNYESALNLFKDNFTFGDFKSSLSGKSFDDIEGIFWKTRTSLFSNEEYINESDSSAFWMLIIGLFLLIIATYFLDKKIRGKKISENSTNTKIKKSKIKKTDEEFLSEWNKKRSEL